MASDDWSIPDPWLERIRGSRLLYPCCGDDIAEPLSVFADYVDHFTFADIRSGYGNRVSPKPESYLPYRTEAAVRRTGDCAARVERLRDGVRSYLDVTPAVTMRTYAHLDTGRQIAVCWRRGFGQYAVRAEPDRGLGVFMHRGDGFGEGGSAVLFLSNRRRRHAPISNLLTQIEAKLADHALVISDGCNTSLKPLKICERQRSQPPGQSFAMADGARFRTDAFAWELVGYMSNRTGGTGYSPTMVWGVTRVD